MGTVHMLSLRLHAQCPECGEYRSHSIFKSSSGKVMLLCNHHREESDAEATRERGSNPVEG